MPVHPDRPARGRRRDAQSVSRRGRQCDQDGRAAKADGRRERCRAGDASRGDARVSLYDEVTARIVAELEAGRVPWVQPWGVAAADGAARLSPSLPHNALTGRAYSGVNVLILWCAAFEHGFASQGWLTFKQAISAGGAVRKGERGTSVVFADRFVPDAEKARSVETGDAAKSVPFLKRFTVNVAQCEGLQGDIAPDPAPLAAREVVPVAEAVIAASGVSFRIGGDRAFYVPDLDFVQMPPQTAFFAPIDYYGVALHELTHATRHPARLARKLVDAFGSKDYAREELVAEMGSAFLCAALGIVPTVRHADYLGHWLAVLREDNRAIFRAASAASRAADWLMARHRAVKSDAATPREDLAA